MGPSRINGETVIVPPDASGKRVIIRNRYASNVRSRLVRTRSLNSDEFSDTEASLPVECAPKRGVGKSERYREEISRDPDMVIGRLATRRRDAPRTTRTDERANERDADASHVIQSDIYVMAACFSGVSLVSH